MSSLDLFALLTRAGRHKDLYSLLVPLATKELSRSAGWYRLVCWSGSAETGGGVKGSVIIEHVTARQILNVGDERIACQFFLLVLQANFGQLVLETE